MCYTFFMKNSKNTTESAFFSKEKSLLPLFSSIFATITFCLYAPVQIYFGNAEEFLFTLYDFWFIPVGVFITVTLILFLIGNNLHGKAKTIFCAILFAAGLLIYLQGSILFENMGVLNGMPYALTDHLSHAIPNTAIWVLAAAIIVLLALKVKASRKTLTSLSIAGSAFILISLILILAGAKSEYLRPRDSFISDKNILNASKEKNVIVIVPDMFDKTYMEAILDETPEISYELEGFTFYDGLEGCFDSTKDSLSYFLNTDPLFSPLDTYGYSFGIYTDSRFIPDSLKESCDNIISGESGINNIPKFIATLYRLVGCSYAPDILRQACWLMGDEFDSLYSPKDSDEALYTISNTAFYEKLESFGINESHSPRFELIHLYGAHYPYITDENLNPMIPSYSDANAIRASRGTLKIIFEYLNKLKKAGAYDNSLIVIMADHGYTEPGAINDPLLMIKPADSTGDFKTAKAYINQADIPEIITDNLP